MTFLQLEQLRKRFGKTIAVDVGNMQVDQGEIICLLGPSGCGKSTLLRLIAGLETPDNGSIKLNGKIINELTPQERRFGLMFQDLSLFPHMNVYRNISFGLKMQKIEKKEIDKRISELLDLVDLNGYEARSVVDLSGGEMQRVALARSLAPNPSILMLDEPLGALDKGLRDKLQYHIKTILKNAGLTSIYVTHDKEEAFVMADRIGFMNEGNILTIGKPVEVFSNPENELVARSLGYRNIFRGVVKKSDFGLEFESEIGNLKGKYEGTVSYSLGQSAKLLIDERMIELHNEEPTRQVNYFQVIVDEIIFKGSEFDIKLKIGSIILVATVSNKVSKGFLTIGRKIWISFLPESVKEIL